MFCHRFGTCILPLKTKLLYFSPNQAGKNGNCMHNIRSYFDRELSTATSKTERNVVLMGSPGCGKTTVGRILAGRLALPVIDVDDHHLEPYWGMTVAQKLDEVGSDGFVSAEGDALAALSVYGSVVSLTGSNPMHDGGMSNIAKSGHLYFLDVHMPDILERLERMKVNRIVGQNDGTSMEEILKFRQQFYEKWYDTRIICERNESPESVADKIMSHMERSSTAGYESTRGESMASENFDDVILRGLARDGGLIVPRASIPKLTTGQQERLVDLNYTERAVRILEMWISSNEMDPRLLRHLVTSSYTGNAFKHPDVCPVRTLSGNRGQYIQELFHGPTASFKDFALQLMPRMFLNALEKQNRKEKYLILVATSGDTGGAVLDGFTRANANASKGGPGVLVFYPRDGISSIQRDQMVAYQSDTTRVIGVRGADFDMCQTAVKQIFQDSSLASDLLENRNIKLSAANSISWGRLLPQVVYHVSSYLDLVKQKVVALGDEIDLCVPTGNFGNILAAYYAKEMGIPFKRLICASNSNNVITDFLSSGCYDIKTRQMQQTTSPAIDILVSSNLERLIYHVTGRNGPMLKDAFERLRDEKYFEVPKEVMSTLQHTFHAGWSSEIECQEAICETLKSSGYLLDPHTAVAKTVADRYQGDRPMLIVSTAHPAKFAHDMLQFLDFQTGSSKPETPIDMIQTLGNLAPKPGIHQTLLQTLSSGAGKGKTACDNSFASMVNEVHKMSKVIG
ncbi:threonine synthase-like 1 [Mya arenaria]|uniref:threonine synthase-like 1 n=1 Tax=Mya arenaria TaxID=6604 RepID=UPI0022E80502|nr:threonine synthase-like 1 [Mya arenaria]